MVSIKDPNAPATKKQLWKLHLLTDEDTSNLQLSMKEASDRISLLENTKPTPILDELDENETPFTEAHVTIVEGEQRSGKTCYGVARIVDSYWNDCVRIYCQEVMNINADVKSYDTSSRIAKIKYNGITKLIQIPESYKLTSPMNIYSRIHLYGVPYIFVPSYWQMLIWLEQGKIKNGWLLMDEAHKGMGARGGMTSLGNRLKDQSLQFGKHHLDVIIVTHLSRLIDWVARTIPTEHVHCSYNKQTYRITYTMRKKGQPGTEEHSFYAPQYWIYYRTDEVVTQ